MNPGDLDQRVTIEQASRAADAYGGAAVTWAEVITVSAKVVPLSGRERAAMSAIEAPASYRFTIRRRAGLTDAMRLVWNGQTFNIRFIADPGRRGAYMSIDGERGVAT